MDGARIGDRVSYEDMANPRRAGVVTSITLFGSGTGAKSITFENSRREYHIRWDDGGEDWSDLRQPGWRPENSIALPNV